jgi:polar amino acid transport system ATP-binding protein
MTCSRRLWPSDITAIEPSVKFREAEHGLTMLMVTHQMGFAKEFADRVCFFYAGRIAEAGPPNELFGSPANERTRQFLSAVLEAG